MQGLDSNILLRYITQDHATLSPRAAQIIETELTSDQPGFLHDIVLCELVWALRTAYQCTRDVISSVLDKLLNAPQLRVTEADVVRAAVKIFSNGAAGFADCLLAQRNRSVGCEETWTFDRDAAKSAGMKLRL